MVHFMGEISCLVSTELDSIRFPVDLK